MFGSRWSVYFMEGSTPRFVLHEDSVVRMLGYLMGSYCRHGSPKPPWELFLDFGGQRLRIERGHFSPDGEDLSRELIQALRAVDPNFDRIKGDDPDFVDLKTRRRLPLTRKSTIEAFPITQQSERTLFDVLSDVFES